MCIRDSTRNEAEGQKLFVFFLYEDEEQSVHIEEVETVNFLEVIQHLNLGGSIFITPRRKPKINSGSEKQASGRPLKPWHFTHI